MTPNDQQKQAIEIDHPRVVVVSCPGSGKTFVVTERVKRLISLGDPTKIAAIAFTTSAARELSDRIGTPIGFCGTLHSFCLRMIVEHYKRPITVMNPAVTESLYLQVMRDMGIRTSIGVLDSEILSPERNDKIGVLARACLSRMKENGMFSYNALLTVGLEAIKQLPIKFDHLLVDEAQDLSERDWEIIWSIKADNRFVVGDTDQALFSFRGGSVEDFLIEAAESKVISLTGNYRCSKVICAAGNSLIKHNEGRIPNQMKSLTGEDGIVKYWSLDGEEAMYNDLAEDILEQPGSCAILVRTNAIVNDVIGAMEQRGIQCIRPKIVVPRDWLLACQFTAYAANPCDTLAKEYVKIRHGYQIAEEKQEEANAKLTSINSVTYQIEHDVPVNKVIYLLKLEGFSEETLSRVKRLTLQAETTGELAALMNDEPCEQLVGNGVAVSTIHSAKGREWDNVYLPWFHQGIIPKIDDEESRRVAYVAITRARKRLVILHHQGEVSQYVKEIAKKMLTPNEKVDSLRKVE